MNGLSFLSLDLFSLTFENIFWPSNGGDHPHRPPLLIRHGLTPGARFTKYLTTILRLSYDNAKVTINLRRTSNLQNIIQ